MIDSQKKIAAAIAAVMEYLQAEETWAAMPTEPAEFGAAASAGLKLWALNGRQTQMQLRNLMQLRALGRMG
jgi:hypothetical protein